MEDNEYIFFSTYYDKEILRQTIFVLEKEHIDFKVINKTNHGSARAPLSVYIEADVLVFNGDFERAIKILGK